VPRKIQIPAVCSFENYLPVASVRCAPIEIPRAATRNFSKGDRLVRCLSGQLVCWSIDRKERFGQRRRNAVV